jgi:hypothetical protein
LTGDEAAAEDRDDRRERERDAHDHERGAKRVRAQPRARDAERREAAPMRKPDGRS